MFYGSWLSVLNAEMLRIELSSIKVKSIEDPMKSFERRNA